MVHWMQLSDGACKSNNVLPGQQWIWSVLHNQGSKKQQKTKILTEISFDNKLFHKYKCYV